VADWFQKGTSIDTECLVLVAGENLCDRETKVSVRPDCTSGFFSTYYHSSSLSSSPSTTSFGAHLLRDVHRHCSTDSVIYFYSYVCDLYFYEDIYEDDSGWFVKRGGSGETSVLCLTLQR
jgi:hypothetical protein